LVEDLLGLIGGVTINNEVDRRVWNLDPDVVLRSNPCMRHYV